MKRWLAPVLLSLSITGFCETRSDSPRHPASSSEPARPSASVPYYRGLIRAYIERFWAAPEGTDTAERRCVLKIEVDDDGAVRRIGVIQAGGDFAFDAAAVKAVRDASPLPLPDNPDVRAKFKSFRLLFAPEIPQPRPGTPRPAADPERR